MKINALSSDGKQVYLAPTGVRIGSKGKVLPVEKALGLMNKGNARRTRKALRGVGRLAEAAAVRSAN